MDVSGWSFEWQHLCDPVSKLPVSVYIAYADDGTIKRVRGFYADGTHYSGNLNALISCPCDSDSGSGVDVVIGGHTAGVTSLISSGTLTLAGGSNITLSQNGSGITILGGGGSQSTQTQNCVDLSIRGNTAGVPALISSGTAFLFGGTNITLSQAGNSITLAAGGGSQSVQTQNCVDITLRGNTSGALALISSGTLSLAGGNNITLSQAGNAITISAGGSQTVQTQNCVDLTLGGNTSGTLTLISSGTAFLAGGNNITLSQVGQSVTISAFNSSQSVQTQNLVDVTLAGNTSGALALISSGTLSLAGGNNITLSQVGNAVTISAFNSSQSVQTQNCVDLTLGGNTSGTLTLISSGTAFLAGGNNVTLSQVGQSVTISAFNQTVQTQNLIDVTLDGNTTGTLALVSSGTLTLAGGNNITLSQVGNAITIEGPATVAGIAFGVSAGTQSVSTGTVSFANSNGITFGMSGSSQITASYTVPTQTVQTQNCVDLTLAGNTSGTLALVSSGTLSLAGGNNITLSQVGNAVTISAFNSSQSVQTQNCVDLTLGGNTSGTLTLISSGTAFLAGGNNITLSQSGQSITISAFNSSQSVQTQNCVDLSLSGNTSGTLTLISSGTGILVGGNNITLSQSGQSVTISAANQSVESQSIGMSNIGNTSGTTGIASGGQVQFLFAGGNNVTLSQSLNGASGTVTISAANQTVESQSLGMSNIGNTSGTTGIASGGQVRFIFAGGNNVTLSQSLNGASGTITISAFTQTVQTQNCVDLSLSGNTTGTLSLISSGTGILAGGNNITLSQNGQSVTISAANQSVESQSIGMSNIGNTSGTTGVASGGQVKFIFAGDNNITLSQSLNGASGTISISAANQSVESQSLGMSNIGNTSGTTGIASGGQVRFLFAGGNNVTLSQSINGASGTITISAFTQTVQTQNCVDLSLSGNTTGTLSLISSGTGILAGGNNITLSQNGQSVTISAAAQTVESQSIGMSNIGNSSGTTGVASGGQVRFVFAGDNNITLSQSLNGASGTISISAFNQTVESQTLGMSNIGNTSGTTGVVSAGQVRYLFAGGNNVTLSQSLNGASGTVTISAANQTVESQTLGMSNIGNTSGTTGVVSAGQVRYLFAGGNNVTLSQSLNGASGTVTISAANQTVESQSIGMSNIGNSSGTTGIASGGQVQFLFAGGNNVTLSQSLNGASGTITISAFTQTNQTVGLYMSSNTTSSVSSGTQDARSISFRGVGVASVGYSAGEVIISVPNAAAGTGTIGMSNIGNTSGDTAPVTGSALKIIFAGGNNVTLSQSTNGSSATITISAFNQTVESQTLGMSNIGNTSGTTGVVSAGQVRYLFAGGNNITLSQSLNGASGTVTISAFNQTVESQSIGMSNIGNTSGTTGIASGGQVQFLFAGGNNVTLSQSLNGASGTVTISAFNQTNQTIGLYMSSNTTSSVSSGTQDARSISFRGVGIASVGYSAGEVIISVPAGGGAAGTQTIGMSNIGNTSGNTTPVTGSALQIVFAGGNNITLSQSTNGSSATITISAPNFNISAGTTSNNLTNVTFSNSNQVSFGLNSSTITASVAGLITWSSWNAYPGALSVFDTLHNASLLLQPYPMPTHQFDRILIPIALSNASNSSGSHTVSVWVGIYTQNISTLSLASSTSASWAVTQSGTQGVYASIGGVRLLTIGSTNTINAGQYFLGVVSRTTSGGANASLSGCYRSQLNSSYSGIFSVASNASMQLVPGYGVYSATTAGVPNSIAFSELVGNSSDAMRSPVVYFLSQTA